MKASLSLILSLILPLSTSAFVAPTLPASRTTTRIWAQGFDKKPPRKVQAPKSAAQIKREQERAKYDELAQQGGQEYAVYVRQFGSSDTSWLPCGSVAVPRGAQVAQAIFANDGDLRKAIVRTYPKLQGFEEEFEFGFNLKVYPDDPIQVAVKDGSAAPKGLSLGNWISTLLSPVDASNVKKN